MWETVGKRGRMERTPDERRDILRKVIKDNGLKIAQWAKASAVAANSIYNFLNGHSEALDARTYGKLARTIEMPVWKLSGDEPEPTSPTAVWVVGFVEAGTFREAIEWDTSLWYSADVPLEDRFKRKAKALEVRGPSMNLEYPERSLVMWVPMLEFRPPRHEDHVIVYRHMLDGKIEATVKELRIVEGKRWLWPRSSDPAHQAPLDLESPGEDVESVEVVGIVVGGYKPRSV